MWQKAHAFNATTWEAEAGRFLWLQDQSGLASEFQVSQSQLLSDKTLSQEEEEEDNKGKKKKFCREVCLKKKWP